MALNKLLILFYFFSNFKCLNREIETKNIDVMKESLLFFESINERVKLYHEKKKVRINEKN